jgi:hypothetical protein
LAECCPFIALLFSCHSEERSDEESLPQRCKRDPSLRSG